MSRSLLSRRAICTYKYSQLYGGRAALHVGRRLGPILCGLSLRSLVVMWGSGSEPLLFVVCPCPQSGHSRLLPAHHREAESCSRYEQPTYLSPIGRSCLAAWEGSRNCSPEVCCDEAHGCDGKRETFWTIRSRCALPILPRRRLVRGRFRATYL